MLVLGGGAMTILGATFERIPVWSAMREVRELRGWSLKWTAEQSLVSTRALALLEAGVQVPTPSQARAWSDTIGIGYGALRTWVDGYIWKDGY